MTWRPVAQKPKTSLRNVHLGEVLWDGEVVVAGVPHAAVAARPEVLAAHP